MLMLNIALTIFLMASKVASDPVCDGDVGSQSCDDRPKSIFQSQKSEYIPGVQGNFEPRTDSDSDHGEGPGAGGQPVHLSGSASDMLKYGMSETVSDLISLSRKVPDTRVTVKITKQKDSIPIQSCKCLYPRILVVAAGTILACSPGSVLCWCSTMRPSASS